MLLCLDIGNTHILGGVFDEGKLVFRFRYATHLIGTSDQLGLFLVHIMQANKVMPEDIHAVALCSVVPGYDYTIRHAISHYFGLSCFVLQAGVRTGLNIKYKNPAEVGADKIANAIAAVNAYPNKNLIIIDLGTATTLCAISKNKDYLGGTILPGLRLGTESLKSNTAKLMEVDIEMPSSYMGRTTRESIQAGLYYGHLGSLREILNGFKRDVFLGESVMVIGTGSFSQLYKNESLFDFFIQDLALQGLCRAYEYSGEKIS